MGSPRLLRSSGSRQGASQNLGYSIYICTPIIFEPHVLQEMRRVFDVCHGCRRCFNLCQSFPTLFDMIDSSPSGELDSVDSSEFKKVILHLSQTLFTFMLTVPAFRLRMNALSATCASSTSLRAQRPAADASNDCALADAHIHRPIRSMSTFPILFCATGLLPQGLFPMQNFHSLR